MGAMDNDGFQAASESFLTWLQGKGATISPKIRLADLRQNEPFGAGRGVVASEDLAEDEELFSIPRSAVLTVENSSLPADALKDVSDPWLSLIVAMVYEHLRGTDSPFKPYFDVLPETFDSLMYWSESDLEHLEGSAVVDKIGKESADTTFTEQLIPVLVQHADTKRLNNEQLLSLCHRMASTIMSYAFDLEKSSNNPAKNEEDGWEEASDDGEALPKGMVPLADMLNADADRNNAKLFYEDDKVVMKTVKAVRSGEELFNDYGPLPRADVLRRYGYVTDNYAQYDVVELSADLIKEKAKKLLNLSANDLDEKWKYAEEQGVLDDAYDIGHAESEGGQFPEELSVLLNLVASSKVEFDKLRKKDKLPKPDALSNDAKKLLRTVLVYRYAMYRPDPDEMEVDEVGPEGRRRAMALQVIQGEKDVLQEAVNAVSDAALGNRKRAANTLEDEAAAIRNPGKR